MTRGHSDVIAFMLVLSVVAMASDVRGPAGVAAVAIDFSLTAGVLLGGPVSGGAGNPARALGPMIVNGLYPVWFYYTAGPLAGAIILGAALKVHRIRKRPHAAVGPPDQRRADGRQQALHQALRSFGE